MAVNLSQGTQLAIASTYGSVATMSAITNATNAVATLSAAHGVAVGDIIEITSGWDRLDSRVARASVVATNDVTLEGIDTSDTSLYPALSGTGSIREITAWTSITQITNVSADAPQVQFADITTLANATRRRIPTLDESPTLTFEVLFDMSLGWVSTVLAASDKNSKVALRMILPSGAKVYANGYVKMSRFPRLAIGEAIKTSITVTFDSIPTSYTS